MSSSARLSLADLCNQPLPPPPPHTTNNNTTANNNNTLPPSSSSSSSSSSAASSPSSPMTSPDVVHAGIKRPLAIEDHDEDVRIAARALGDMRSRAVSHARAPSAEAFAVASKTHSRTSSASQSTPFLSPSTTPSTISNSSPQLRQRSLDRDHHHSNPNHYHHYHHHHHHHHNHHNQDLPSPPEHPPKDFVSRVVHSPIVSSVLNAYEDSKKRSKVVQIGANLMESSVKTISRPVINRLPVNQLDEFACRQLDRIYPIRSAPSSPNADTPKMNHNNHHHHHHLYTAYRDPAPLESGASSRAPSVTPPDDYSASNSPILPIRNLSDDSANKSSPQQQQQQQEIAAKSKWQTMLCEAGGISAAVSQESMKRLQYCLQWLQYATNRIDSQIVVLRGFIDSLTPKPPHENDPHALVPLQVMRTLTDVRRDLVKTIREVVKVISTYAGSALPEPARSTVRTFLLRLPARWANASGGSGGAGDTSNPPSMPSSPRLQQHQRLPSSENLAGCTPGSLSPTSPVSASTGAGAGAGQTESPHSLRPTAGRATHPTALAATQAAQRVLTLATESLDMMRSVTNVFKESLERADAWVERFRIVGIQRHDGTSSSGVSGDLHMLSSPGAGPSNNNTSNTSTSSTSNSNSSNSLSPSDMIKSPSEPDLRTIHYQYSQTSSSLSLSSSAHDPSLPISYSNEDEETTMVVDMAVMKKKRRKRISDISTSDEAVMSMVTNGSSVQGGAEADENGHVARTEEDANVVYGDDEEKEKERLPSENNRRMEEDEEVEGEEDEGEGEENDETETEDGAGVPFSVCSTNANTSSATESSSRKRDEKEKEKKKLPLLDDDIMALSAAAVASGGGPSGTGTTLLGFTADEDEDEDEIEISAMASSSSSDVAATATGASGDDSGLRKRNNSGHSNGNGNGNGCGSGDDDCSDASFYSARTRPMDIDCE